MSETATETSPADPERQYTKDTRPPPRLKDWFLGWSWWLKEYTLPAYISESEPIVVGGCGRSGTTLLQVILDAHPELCCVRESSVLHLGKLDTSKLSNRLRMPIDRVRAIADTSSRHGEFVERICSEYAAGIRKTRWADKSPRNVRRLSYIFKHFPKARFVHVVRDGRDAVCSLRTHPKYRRIGGELVEVHTWKSMEECAGRWQNDVHEGIAWRGHPGYFELRYEDLVTEPEPVLRELFDFLGADWTPAVMDYHQVEERSAKDPGFEKPLFTSSIGRWKRHMSHEDVRTFKSIAGPLLQHMGYADDDAWECDGTATHGPDGPPRPAAAPTADGKR